MRAAGWLIRIWLVDAEGTEIDVVGFSEPLCQHFYDNVHPLIGRVVRVSNMEAVEMHPSKVRPAARSKEKS